MTAATSEPDNRRAELEERLAQIEEEYWSIADPGWRMDLGRIRVHRRYSSQTFAKVFVSFNAVLFVVGVALSFAGGTVASLGVAVVVGALFSFGSFLTEVWSQAVDREQELRSEDIRDDLGALRRRRHEVLGELLSMDQPDEDGPTASSR
jgi:hypothetical protein